MELDRRSFLRRAGQVCVATAVGRVALDVFTPLGQSAGAAIPSSGPLPSGTPIVVLIDLQGGNDGVNTLIDLNDPWYHDVPHGHGNLAIPSSQVLNLSGTTLGVHPSLAWLAGRWGNKGDVAFVQGIGENVKNEFSHFAAGYYRAVADFSGSEARGWLGRYNDLAAPGSPLASVSLSGIHPALLGAVTPVLTVASAANFNANVDWRWRSGFAGGWQAMGQGSDPSMLGSAKQNVVDTFAAQSAVSSAYNASYDSQFSPGLGKQLAQAAMLIQAGFPSQTYVAVQPGFDTHGSESWTHGDLLSKLDAALKGFFSIIDGGPRAKDVFVLVSSEFGRQQTGNASAGCDHGQAAANMVLGGGVKGGLYGQAPATDPTHRLNDALVPTVDFRSLYATALNRLCGDPNQTAAILNGPFADLGIFTSGPSQAPAPPTGGGTTTTTTAPPKASPTTSTTTPKPIAMPLPLRI
jgi:uncharacterized protein (DUF1501 family)